MRKQTLYDALDQIDPKYVDEANRKERYTERKKYSYLRPAGVVAAMLVVCMITLPKLGVFNNKKGAMSEEINTIAPDTLSNLEDKSSLETLTNPMVEIGDIDKVNEDIGCDILRIEGATDEFIYEISSKIAGYRFSYDGAEYEIRAAATMEDISGIFVTGGTLGEVVPFEYEGVVEGYHVARWFDGNIQYILTSDNTSKEDFDHVRGLIHR